MGRRAIAAVVGSARAEATALQDAASLGTALVDAGFRVATGGLGGVMDAALAGARDSPQYREGDTLAFLPTYSDEHASRHADVVIRTGLQHGRNAVMIASADVVLAIGGRAGTLNELALAWELGRPIIVVGATDGWALRLTGLALDDRRTDHVIGPLAPADAAVRARELLGTLTAPREYR